MALPIVGAIVSIVSSISGELLADWKQSRQSKREIKKAAAEFRQEQARSKENYRQEWELRALEGRDLLMARVSFFLISFPLVWGYFDPAGMAQYFEIIEQTPEWYRVVLFGVWGSIWGFAELRNLRAGK